MTHRSDREHATILASNFPQGTSDDQVRHFFKEVFYSPKAIVDRQCGTIKQLERTGDEGEEGESFVIEFENEVHVQPSADSDVLRLRQHLQ